MKYFVALFLAACQQVPESPTVVAHACGLVYTFPGGDRPTEFPRKVLVDSRTITAERSDVVLQAITAWNERFGFELFTAMETDNTPDQDSCGWVSVIENDALARNADGTDGPRIASTSWSTCQARSEFRHDLHGRDLAVIQHELGHTLGLEHVNDPDDLMYHAVSRSDILSEDAQCQIEAAININHTLFN